MDTDFLSSGKNFFLFRALLKVLKFGGGNAAFGNDSVAIRIYFFPFLRYSF